MTYIKTCVWTLEIVLQSSVWKIKTEFCTPIRHPKVTDPICVKICCVPFLIVTWILSRSNLDSDIEIFWKWIKSFLLDLLKSNSVGGIAFIVNLKRSKHFLIFSSISVVSYFVYRNSRTSSTEPGLRVDREYQNVRATILKCTDEAIWQRRFPNHCNQNEIRSNQIHRST